MQNDKIKVKLAPKEAKVILNFAEYWNDGIFDCRSFKDKLIDIEGFKNVTDIGNTIRDIYDKMLGKMSTNE